MQTWRTQGGPRGLGARVQANPRRPANRTGKPKAQSSLSLSQASGPGYSLSPSSSSPRPRCGPGAAELTAYAVAERPGAAPHRSPQPSRTQALGTVEPGSERPDPSRTS